MAYQNARDRYVTDGAGVVSQPRLLVMLYDRLVLDLEQADAAMGAKQIQAVNDKLTHAQSIILELNAALDHDAWSGADNLGQLYTWFNQELIQANVKKDPGPLRSCLKMIRELQGAWHKAHEQVLADQATAPASTTAIASA